MQSVNTLGVSVAVTHTEDVCHKVMSHIATKQSLCVYVAAIHLIMESRTRPRLQSHMNKNNLVVPDGMPLVWVQRFYGYTNASRVYGPNLFLRLLALSDRKGWSVYFLGGSRGQSKDIQKRLEVTYPHIQIVGVFDTPNRSLTNKQKQQIVQNIRSSKAQIVFVGMGCPYQEVWMSEQSAMLPGVTMVGVGAAFDFFVGKQRQAPPWVGSAGFEWLFRLITNPGRLWYRYSVLGAAFIFLIIGQFMRDIIRRLA